MAKRSAGRDALRDEIKAKLKKNIVRRVKEIAEQNDCDEETAKDILRKLMTDSIEKHLKANGEKDEKRKIAKAVATK
jgi:chorismate mutase